MKSGEFVLSRRQMVKALAGLAAALSTTAITPVSFGDTSPTGTAFSFDILTAQMKALAQRPYQAYTTPLPTPLQNISYDGYREIQPLRDHAVKLSQDFGYIAEPFHMGWLFKEPVEMYQVKDGQAHEVSFTAADFNYHDAATATAMAGITIPGVAGFRMDCPMNEPSVMSELVAFLGASYFRALGKGNMYGASARGAVLNSWLSQPEEFPRFSAFYLAPAEYPAPIAVYAALEGPSLTGAFQFVFDPAKPDRQDTQVDVTARFFFRADVAEMGIAPLTSMFLYSDSNRSQFDDYRPQVHDSDGLLMDGGTGEMAWRALNNPTSLGNSYFAHNNPKAFGLMQRARQFVNYQDDGARYDLRPSILVEPQGDWGEGSVRLIEVPAKLEADDNIVAFWVPKAPFRAGDNAEFKYRLRWGDLLPDPKGPIGYVADTRTGQGGVSGVANKATLRKFVIDFAGGALATLDADEVDAVASIAGQGGKVIFSSVSKIPETGVMRLAIDAEIDTKDPVELRAYLVGGGRQLTETWLYQWRAA